MKINLFKRFSSSKGFTLIELLIVIAIIGVLAAGILVLLDPVDKINAANDSKVQNDVSNMGRASEAYATTHNGAYPSDANNLVDAGELKRKPTPPNGYGLDYQFTTTPPSFMMGIITRVIVSGQLKSKKFTQASPATPFWNFDTDTGRSCAAINYNTGCP